MENIVEYLKQFKPSLNRDGEKYYSEMQQLAYNLVKYLSMNDDPNEKCFQGNWNLTFLLENMTEDNFMALANMFLKRIPMYKVRQMIHSTWGEESAKLVLEGKDSELEKNYNDLVDDYNELKEKYDNIRGTLKGLIELQDEN